MKRFFTSFRMTYHMIPVNEPVLSANAKKYVNDCLDTGWISSAGSYISRFEQDFSTYIGTKYAVTTTNGTTALHLALASLGIGPGDEVIVPDLTIISCVAAVIYTGATPVLVDVEPTYGTLDPDSLARGITPNTKAIMPVHLYGHPADMDRILEIANQHGIPVIEDAAEAHGALYKDRKAGSLGTISCFSFYANKLITTGEGGMICTNDQTIYEKAKLLKDLAHVPGKRFYHQEIGFNYRMTNLQAAIGVAELEQIDSYISHKRTMAQHYNKLLRDILYLELPQEADWARSSFWMYAVRVRPDSPIDKDTLRAILKEKGIDTRDFFYPLHKQPALHKKGLGKKASCPVSIDLSSRGFYLPSGLALSNDHIEIVSKTLHTIFKIN